MLKFVESNIKVSSRQVLAIDSFKDIKQKSQGCFSKASKMAKTIKGKASKMPKSIKAEKKNTKSNNLCCHFRMRGH